MPLDSRAAYGFATAAMFAPVDTGLRAYAAAFGYGVTPYAKRLFFLCSPFWTCPIQFFRIGTIEGQSLGDAGWKNRAAFKDERVSKTKQNVVLKRVSMMAWGLVFRKSEVFGFDGAEGLPSGSGEVENGVSEFGEWDERVGIAAF